MRYEQKLINYLTPSPVMEDAASIGREADARIAELEGALHNLKVTAEPFLNSSDPHEPGEQVLNQAQKALNNGPR